MATKPPMSVKEPSIPAKPIIIISAKIAQIIEYIPRPLIMHCRFANYLISGRFSPIGAPLRAPVKRP
jgi:hypothetical protein